MGQVFRALGVLGEHLRIRYAHVPNHAGSRGTGFGLHFSIDGVQVTLDKEQTETFIQWVFDNFEKVGE